VLPGRAGSPTLPLQFTFYLLPEHSRLKPSMGSGGSSGKVRPRVLVVFEGTLMFHSQFYSGSSRGTETFLEMRMAAIAFTSRCCGDEIQLLSLLDGSLIGRSPATILEYVCNSSFQGLTNVSNAYISALPGKIDRNFPQKLIQTNRGVGYPLTCFNVLPALPDGRPGRNDVGASAS
jgi:hypothetical protein